MQGLRLKSVENNFHVCLRLRKNVLKRAQKNFLTLIPIRHDKLQQPINFTHERQ